MQTCAGQGASGGWDLPSSFLTCPGRGSQQGGRECQQGGQGSHQGGEGPIQGGERPIKGARVPARGARVPARGTRVPARGRGPQQGWQGSQQGWRGCVGSCQLSTILGCILTPQRLGCHSPWPQPFWARVSSPTVQEGWIQESKGSPNCTDQGL